ncbi:transcriptional repressor [Gilvimarinus sp. F26214L]|uniref:transcriptional repressor n=1 Tax=Gilvimarinus sp. DZF01 TaxID=3461371 RepID=UPI00404667A8
MDSNPFTRHDHRHCIESALTQARQLCADRGVRLTPQREQVLRLVWQSHKPLGAYPIMDMLADATTRPVAPPTVYRALDFLTEQTLIHKIHSLNAFVGCPNPGRRHQGHFLICRSCRVALECGGVELNNALARTASTAGFTAEQQSVEILGLCPACKECP